MPNFRYKARDKFARAVSGTSAAENKDVLARKLQDMGYIPISIEDVRASGTLKIFNRFQRIRPEELHVFTRQLYVLQRAGLPLLTGLNAIAEQTKNKYFKVVIDEISSDIKGGLSFSSALGKHARIFDPVYISMIKAAEAGGFFAEILERLSLLLEQEIDTHSRIKAATRYPILAFFVLCAGFLVLTTFVIPRFAAVYGQFKAALPLPTRILIAISVTIKRFWPVFVVVFAGIIFGFRQFIKSKGGRIIWDNLKLKVPIFGPLVTMLIMSRFARIWSILMKSGVPILEVLELSSKASGNVIISRAILSIKESVNQGKGLSEPMKLSGLFPAVVVQMVAIGEQTGRIDELLLNVADYYDSESGYIIKNLVTYIEPILIFILACMVLTMALAIFLPMWNLIKVFRPH